VIRRVYYRSGKLAQITVAFATCSRVACLQYVLETDVGQWLVGWVGDPKDGNFVVNFVVFCCECVGWWASLCDWDIGVGQEGVLASLEHARCEVAHDRLGLNCQVPEHFVGAPAA
jgi:hypothetical protein